jgi:serine/threonine protein kinase
VKILDFGLAKPLAGDVHLTQTGHIVGTPAYMSPEQVSCREVGVRSDLYSFAAIVYEALVGRRVTVKEELAAIFVDVLQNEPPSVSALLPGVPVPVEIDEAFLWALSKEPEQRPADVDQWVASFVDRLESLPSDVAGWPSAEGASFDPTAPRYTTLVNPPLR